MTEAEIVRCRVRADDVINGFTSAKITHAKDVIRLANELLAANRKIDEMRPKATKPGAPPDFFNEIFGKKP